MKNQAISSPVGSAPVLEVSGLTKTFGARAGLLQRWQAKRNVVTALDGVSLILRKGEIVGLVGESGSGKSTLARCLVGLERPDHGEILCNGNRITYGSKRHRRQISNAIQMVFQDPYSSLNPQLSIGAAIQEALSTRDSPKLDDARLRVDELFALVGLSTRLRNSRPCELSGGQRQRVAIARALAANPRILIADEIVSALDVSVQAQILNLVLDLTERLGLATLFVAHQLAVVAAVADRVAVMYLGRIVEQGPARDVLYHPQHPYTRALVQATPAPIAMRQKHRPAIRGEMPSPYQIPSGCRFRTRCQYAEDICLQAPTLYNSSADRVVECSRAPLFPLIDLSGSQLT